MSTAWDARRARTQAHRTKARRAQHAQRERERHRAQVAAARAMRKVPRAPKQEASDSGLALEDLAPVPAPAPAPAPVPVRTRAAPPPEMDPPQMPDAEEAKEAAPVNKAAFAAFRRFASPNKRHRPVEASWRESAAMGDEKEEGAGAQDTESVYSYDSDDVLVRDVQAEAELAAILDQASVREAEAEAEKAAAAAAAATTTTWEDAMRGWREPETKQQTRRLAEAQARWLQHNAEAFAGEKANPVMAHLALLLVKRKYGNAARFGAFPADTVEFYTDLLKGAVQTRGGPFDALGEQDKQKIATEARRMHGEFMAEATERPHMAKVRRTGGAIVRPPPPPPTLVRGYGALKGFF